MVMRSVLLFLALIATAGLTAAQTQTLTLDFDAAPGGPLPWSEQGFTFDGVPAAAQIGAGAMTQTVDVCSPGNCNISVVSLARDDGGAFDLISLDVVDFFSSSCNIPYAEVESDTGGYMQLNPFTDPETVVLAGPGWTDITELFVRAGAFGTQDCENVLVTDNFVVETTVAECFLVIGDGPGDATFFDAAHLFETQLDGVEDSYEVLMDDIPEFVLPEPGRDAGGIAVGENGESVTFGDVPPWMWDGHFTLQILMWNPGVFPELPEQFSYGLRVYVSPNGSVSARPFGDGTGITVWAETDVNADGRPVVRFPFLVPGM